MTSTHRPGSGLGTAIAAVLLIGGGSARAEPPRGVRSQRVTPTDVVIAQSDCQPPGKVGGALVIRPGVAVAVHTRGKQTSQVTIAGPARARCALPTASLGLRAGRDIATGGGIVYSGALVRPLSRRAPRGQRWIETVGAVTAELLVPADALTAAPLEFIYRPPPSHHFLTPFDQVALYERKESVGTTAPVVGRVAAESDVVLLEQDGVLARVRTHGPVEVEGWALAKQFADRRAQPQTAELLRPTHELLVVNPLYADARGRRVIARLQGGVLVELSKREGGRVKVTTTGDVIATGYVDSSALRPLITDDDDGDSGDGG